MAIFDTSARIRAHVLSDLAADIEALHAADASARSQIAAAPLTAIKGAQQRQNVAAQRPNLFTIEEIDTTTALRTGNASTVAAYASSFGNVPCWAIDIPVYATERGTWFGPFPRAAFEDLGQISASLELLSLDGYAGPNGNQKARMLVRQYSAAAATLITTQVDITTGNEAVATPATFGAAAVALNAATAYVWIWLGVLNQNGAGVRTLKFRNPYVAAGAVADFVRPTRTIAPKLARQLTLPNNVSNPNTEGYGFTCTGLCRAHNGLWAVANVGVATEAQNANGDPSYFAPSLVFVTSDARIKVAEILLRPILPSIKSIQGLCLDTSNGSYWFTDITSKRFRNVSYAGALLGSIDQAALAATGWTPTVAANGLSFDPAQRRLWAHAQGTGTLFLIDIATTAVVRTIDGVPTDIDHLHYDPATKFIWWTQGENGVDGTVTVFDSASSHVLRVLPMTQSRAIEGVYFDAALDRLFVVNDQGLHLSSGTPPVAHIAEYKFTL